MGLEIEGNSCFIPCHRVTYNFYGNSYLSLKDSAYTTEKKMCKTEKNFRPICLIVNNNNNNNK